MLVPRFVERRSPFIAPARTRVATSINCSNLRRVFSSKSLSSAIKMTSTRQSQSVDQFPFFDLACIFEAQIAVQFLGDSVLRQEANKNGIISGLRTQTVNECRHRCP